MDHYLDNPDRWSYRRAYAERNYPPGTRVRLVSMPDDPSPIFGYEGICFVFSNGNSQRSKKRNTPSNCLSALCWSRRRWISAWI